MSKSNTVYHHTRKFSIIVIVEGHSVHAAMICDLVWMKKCVDDARFGFRQLVFGILVFSFRFYITLGHYFMCF